MTKSNLFKLALSGLLCATGISSLSAQLEYDPETFWAQPHIRAGYIGDYELNVPSARARRAGIGLTIEILVPLIELTCGHIATADPKRNGECDRHRAQR